MDPNPDPDMIMMDLDSDPLVTHTWLNDLGCHGKSAPSASSSTTSRPLRLMTSPVSPSRMTRVGIPCRGRQVAGWVKDDEGGNTLQGQAGGWVGHGCQGGNTLQGQAGGWVGHG